MHKNVTLIALGCSGLALAIYVGWSGTFSIRERLGNPNAARQVASSDGQRIAQLVDPALQSALAERNSHRRRESIRNWADSIGVNALADELTRVNALADAKWKAEIQGALLASWGRRDLAGALSWFGARGAADPLQEQARDLLVAAMAHRDPFQMFAWMQDSLPGPAQNELYGPFFRQWADSNPADAGASLGRLANPAEGQPASAQWNDLLAQVAAQWGSSHLGDAVKWVESLPQGPAKTQALLQMSYRWTQVDPKAAATYAARQGDLQLLKTVASEWAESDPQSAADWADELTDGAGRDGAVATLAAVWAQKDPASAAAYLMSLAPEKAQGGAAVAMVSTLAADHPAQAAQWVAQFPEGPLRERVVGELVNVWASNDAAQAARWVQGLPKSPSRDVAVNTYSRVLNGEAPALAFQWAKTISDAAMRNEQLQHVARTWLQKEPTVARTEILKSDLPANLKTSLLANSASTAP